MISIGGVGMTATGYLLVLLVVNIVPMKNLNLIWHSRHIAALCLYQIITTFGTLSCQTSFLIFQLVNQTNACWSVC